MSGKAATTAIPIPDDVALRVCEEIKSRNAGKWYTFNGLWCTFCAKFSAAPEQRCFANAAAGGNRGCAQVSNAFDATTRDADRRAQ